MSLRFNSKTGDYIIISEDRTRAKKAGLTLSRSAKGINGEPVFYTQSPYAALEYWDEADSSAKNDLQQLYDDYQKSWLTKSDKIFKAPRGQEFMPFQKAGIEFGLGLQNVLIGDEMGLGKTCQAIGIANAMKAERILVVCPAGIRLNWKREIEKWSIIPNKTIYPVLKSRNGIGPDQNWVIISYDLARNPAMHEILYDEKWDLIIMDEIHYLKTSEAQRTRALFGGGRGLFLKKRLADRADKLIGLTGTPLPNRPREAYTIARGLCPEAIDWMSYDRFVHRFNPSKQSFVTDKVTHETKIFTDERKGRLPELRSRLRCNFMIRRLKKDVLTDLPDKRYEFTYIEENGAIKDALQRERMLEFSVDDLTNPWSEIIGQISTVRRLMGEAKAPRMVEHLKMQFDIMEVPKIAFFAHHRTVMDHIYMSMKDYGVVEIRGGMSPEKKDLSVQRFIRDPKIRLFSGQLEAAGFGVDGLQHATNRVVIGEPAWAPGANEQVIDRTHRIGQHDNVLAQFLVVEGSLDERVLWRVLDKSETIHEALDAR